MPLIVPQSANTSGNASEHRENTSGQRRLSVCRGRGPSHCGVPKDHEAGVSVADLCRKHAVSDASISKWTSRFGGMEISEARWLKALEDKNAKLKQMLANVRLHSVALKNITGKKG